MPFVGLVGALAAQKAANNAIAAKTTKDVTYRGQTFQMKRTADSILTGSATDRIEQLETQLAFCYTTLLADTLNATCPPERQATIRAALKYIDLARPNWDQKAYRQEFRFYLAEDKRRNRAINPLWEAVVSGKEAVPAKVGELSGLDFGQFEQAVLL
nr:hypothetical protein [Tanacetum cinerariifolium]